MKKKLVAALAALAAPANAQMGGSWLDSMVANEIGFTQQWNGYVTQGMNDLVASCMDHIQRTGTRCLAGYDASILSSANLGYDDYNAAMAANSAATKLRRQLTGRWRRCLREYCQPACRG